MKKILLVAFILFNQTYIFAQVPTLQQKLYYTCKVWGFVKYYHSNVSTCHVNWDSVLIHVLPAVESATNDSEFNDALDSMIAAAGPMSLSNTYFPDTLAPELKRNRDWSWISSTVLRNDVQIQLDTIKNNFRPHPGCNVEIDTTSVVAFGSNGGYLLFPPNTPLLNYNTASSYPNENNRLLLLFKYWNIVNYFNPYNYVSDKSPDSILSTNVLYIDSVSNPFRLYQGIKKITSAINDAHVEGLTYSAPITYPAEYVPKIMLRYMQGQYIVVKSGEAGINIGDAIISVNGQTVSQIEDSLRDFVSAGNISVFRRYLCEQYLLWGTHLSHVNLEIQNPSGSTHNDTLTRSIQFFNAWFPLIYYPADSISAIGWTTMGCGTGYINGMNLASYDAADTAYTTLYNAPAIIIDLRGNTNGAILETAWDMLSEPTLTSIDLFPDVNYPGTFYWGYADTSGYIGNDSPYNGTVILLINQETQSHDEYNSMVFTALPHVIKIGSQTAGADGDVTFFKMTQDIHSGFSNIGIFYPNGDSTQRIGIVPDSIVTPTVAGILQGRDEVLEKALQIACSLATVKPLKDEVSSIKAFPDPANDLISVEGANVNSGYVIISIEDITGRILFQNRVDVHAGSFLTPFNISLISSGFYYICINTETTHSVMKFVKR